MRSYGVYTSDGRTKQNFRQLKYPMLKKDTKSKISSTKPKSQHKQHDLTPDQKQEIREAFDLFDSDGSG